MIYFMTGKAVWQKFVHIWKVPETEKKNAIYQDFSIFLLSFAQDIRPWYDTEDIQKGIIISVNLL